MAITGIGGRPAGHVTPIPGLPMPKATPSIHMTVAAAAAATEKK
jgi:hypothetical protein